MADYNKLINKFDNLEKIIEEMKSGYLKKMKDDIEIIKIIKIDIKNNMADIKNIMLEIQKNLTIQNNINITQENINKETETKT